MFVSFHLFAVMAPTKWANKRQHTDKIELSQLLKMIKFMKERLGQVTEVEFLKTFSVRHNVAYELVEQQLIVLRTRQLIKTEFQYVSVQAHMLNRVFN